jgi:hypothetical protein
MPSYEERQPAAASIAVSTVFKKYQFQQHNYHDDQNARKENRITVNNTDFWCHVGIPTEYIEQTLGKDRAKHKKCNEICSDFALTTCEKGAKCEKLHIDEKFWNEIYISDRSEFNIDVDCTEHPYNEKILDKMDYAPSKEIIRPPRSPSPEVAPVVPSDHYDVPIQPAMEQPVIIEKPIVIEKPQETIVDKDTPDEVIVKMDRSFKRIPMTEVMNQDTFEESVLCTQGCQVIFNQTISL